MLIYFLNKYYCFGLIGSRMDSSSSLLDGVRFDRCGIYFGGSFVVEIRI